MKAIKFTKMQGLGNDYVYINGFEEHVPDPSALAKRVSDRHFGIGSDGLVLILPSNKADVRMRMFNPDGSEAEMCGNAIRCVGKFVFDNGLCTKDTVQVETAAGIRIVRLLKDGGEITGATVDMGAPVLNPADIPANLPEGMEGKPFVNCPVMVDGVTYEVTAVSMGNPHAVIFLRGIDSLDLPDLGPKFEHHPLFPQRTNTEFVEVVSRSRVRMRVWERGTGETLACGTGACAVAVACVLNELTERSVDVELPGGVLRIVWDKADNHVYMSGPASKVFDGALSAWKE
ncbi:diaminopimelate epimerase [uncultured Desulfovibrio sp.]|uniref:Diaminopimelate epimerase n=1 Tax=Candidatus Desulfovibrio intestinavium TaxID=2838534 RepID=A0A9D2HPM1_9BACT|nr:diaminopimelate epimerase [uncultured Desulfovibrio sp.]HJA79629.1 diaminopimelate epimerase [Candidatus Desulfovibrio intestinavium]